MTQKTSTMMSLIEEISPLARMVNSPGLDRTFDIIKRELPEAIIHEFPAGKEYEDWIVPKSWQATEGYIKDEQGNVIASIEECYLFVAPLCEPVEGWFTKQEIANHIRTRPDRPDAFFLEHRNAYNYQLVDWGITMPHNRWQQLPEEGKYFVKIAVERQDKPMKLAEYFLQGEGNEIITICAHIDELCNDDLVSCIVALELMRRIEKIPDRKYSYQMLLGPEMFSTLFYLAENPEKASNTIVMLNLETLGAGDNLCLKKALSPECWFEDALRLALEHCELSYKELDFFSGFGNDERIFAWPTVNIPGIALQRHPFAEYHTSDDTPSLIREDYLEEGLEVCEKLVKIVENDFIPEYTGTLMPWLTRRKLYFDSIDSAELFHKFNNLLLFNIDGKKSLVQLAKLAGIDFFKALKFLNKFIDQGVIKAK